MNRAIAAVYAISIRSPINGKVPDYTEREKDSLIACIPGLISEITRLEGIAHDPFVRGYVERFMARDE